MSNVAILTSGGDNCANTSLIKEIRDNLVQTRRGPGFERVMGVRYGFDGLLDLDVEEITHTLIDPNMPSSILGTSRQPPVYTAEAFEKMRKEDGDLHEGKPTIADSLDDYNHSRAEVIAKNLVEQLECDNLVVIGGDGTIRAVKEFMNTLHRKGSKHKIKTIVVPSTMDNDFNTRTHHGNIDTAVNSGFPSAVERVVTEAKGLDYFIEKGRRVMFVETLGRSVGWVAVSLANARAYAILCPEFTIDPQDPTGTKDLGFDIKDKLYERIGKALSINRGYVKIGISEGTPYFFNPEEEKEAGAKSGYQPVTTHSSGSRRLGGAGHMYLSACTRHFTRSGVRIYPSYHNTGYKPKMPMIFMDNEGHERLVGPSAYDAALSAAIGKVVAEYMTNGPFDVIPALEHVVPRQDLDPKLFKPVPLDDVDVTTRSFRVPEQYLDRERLYVSDMCFRFLNMLLT